MTRKILLIAGVAGLAITVPAVAEKGGRGDDDRPSQAGTGKSSGPKAQRQEKAKEQVQRAEQPKMQRMERQQVQRAERPERAQRKAERQVQRVERQQQRVERQDQRIKGVKAQRVEHADRVDRKTQRIERQAERIQRSDTIRAEQALDRKPQKADRRSVDQRLVSRDKDRARVGAASFDERGHRSVARLFSGHDMRQMKPFKAKFDAHPIPSIGDRVASTRQLSAVPLIYAGRYTDTPDHYYRYDNDLGYVYRIERDDGIVRSLIPLFGGYGAGDPWPATYHSSYVPLGYRDYYYDTPDYFYRNDGYGIYQVDSGTQLITALVSLLTGRSLGIGQALPAGYGAYNVPLAYRSSYYDTDDSWYRYDDGFIYQVDPSSRRVAARYPIYGDDYYVGDPWPVAYPDYNVPYGYRSLYSDTPQYQYRYANNGIYQVDPTNRMILALVALLGGDRFAVGQQIPSGYDTYNVPFDYRDRYADNDRNWYRYADGYVYRVDAGSGLIEDAFPVYA